uniref:Cysteine protease Nivulian-2 (Fragments) n=1 Tax=Euphorbia nivulia TaxID=334690 RepID=NIVU2_EUPNI|nr:RecName: Full=Cysteine protease Nivulian-2; AltName: Full=Nivulian-II [Euphorbia nivulia]
DFPPNTCCCICCFIDRMYQQNHFIISSNSNSSNQNKLVSSLEGKVWVQDVPSLHLLRFFLYEYRNWNSFITPKKCESMFVFLRDPFIHYVRYQAKSFLAARGTPLMMNKSQMLENSFLIDIAINKAKFCNALGHPISKPVRVWYLDIIRINDLVNHD